MVHSCWKITLVLTVLAALGLGASSPAAAQSYTVQDLGPLSETIRDANGFNNRGQVAGVYVVPEPAVHAFLWENGKMTDLGTLGGLNSQGMAVNNFGQVVGYSMIQGTRIRENTPFRAFLWENGKITDLGTLGGTWSFANAINDQGQIAGSANIAEDLTRHAVLWEQGKMIDLGTLGGDWSVAWDINDSGQVVGSSAVPGSVDSHAVLWDKGKITDLGTLGGSYCYARAINNLGQVVGVAATPGGEATRAFLWEEGKMVDLGTLGGLNSFAWGINNLGQVVGYAQTAFGDFHVFLWDRISGMKDLNGQIAPGSGWELQYALSINDAGEIVGMGSYKLQLLPYLVAPRDGRILTEEEAIRAREAIELISSDVKQAKGLSEQGIVLHLIQTLSAAETRLVNGKVTAAINLLQAFVNQVDALINEGTSEPSLPRSDGQRWIDAARELLTQLSR
jgi:probable HAF family extracellular repeat protein